MIRLVVADDQDLVRAGIVATVEAQPDMRVIAEVRDGDQAVRAVTEGSPDVVLMDIRMPGIDGIEATRRIVERGSSARVLLLTTFDADEHVYGALRAGASGFLVKDAPVDELVTAIRAAARGDAVLSPSVTARVVGHLLERPFRGAPEDAIPAGLLTPREIEVVQLVADGLSNVEIGRLIHLSEATVKTHIGRILVKLGLRDRVQVAVWAHRRGVANPPG
ncbi:response regulator [Microbacterium murale]|uniref:DNA-binding NarL/FixJ family response regulator n=1 Tax=Microbacterium murale TaxID=1081040 RepID=A0ABU0P8H0_9MICO|nr:response regulator transcription factor [Microbacterium murale]MDQ0643623.1 DNA-binding NarL/FixJ family response regulator [Microbacterium murale]